MNPPHTLLLDGQGLTVYRRQGKRWIAEGHFRQTPDEQGIFANYLQQHRQQRFRLLVDLAQEEITIDHIPRLRGSDRQALVERKLEQHFPGQTLRCASTLGPEIGTPAREKLRLAALTHSATLTTWLSLLTTENSRLCGIYSSSQLAGAVQQQLGKATPYSLLLVQNQQVIREFFLRNSQLELARSVAVDTENPQQIAQEAERLQHYLRNQHRLAGNEPLPVFVLGHRAASDDSTDPLFHYFPEISEPSALFLAALEGQPPKVQFANNSLLQTDRRARRRSATHAFVTLLALVSLPLAAVNIYEAENLQQQTAQLLASPILQPLPAEQSAAGDDRRLSAATLRHLSEHHGQLRQAQQLPRAALTPLSRILEQHPSIQLEKLRWQNAAGRIHLTLQGYLNSPPEQHEEQLADFMAALSVDRDRLVKHHAEPPTDEQAATWRGSHEPAPTPSPQNFHLTIGGPPP